MAHAVRNPGETWGTQPLGQAAKIGFPRISGRSERQHAFPLFQPVRRARATARWVEYPASGNGQARRDEFIAPGLHLVYHRVRMVAVRELLRRPIPDQVLDHRRIR
jgi:hypothetical protein